MKKIMAAILCLGVLLISACNGSELSLSQFVDQSQRGSQIDNLVNEVATVDDVLLEVFTGSREDLIMQFQDFGKEVCIDYTKIFESMTDEEMLNKAQEIVDETNDLAAAGIAALHDVSNDFSEETKTRILAAKTELDKITAEIMDLAHSGEPFAERFNAMFKQLGIIIDPENISD